MAGALFFKAFYFYGINYFIIVLLCFEHALWLPASYVEL
ncbi:hypothetical protein CCACVL1_09315 [Corchorus capsularis]|uniref:Uncharacterized protein n=1 Tax=Corchorus capsularis TaxID=210143 RepID=A0A1R3IWR3_COCAP|nr:hypothetical protein CCACVL1_09315 [Corchorus capsularis]